ncbi:DUF2975 domain-containing protein, partial [Lentilactobacillus hilgardii]
LHFFLPKTYIFKLPLTIKKMILGMGICYTLFLPFIYRVADSEDAPGLVLMFGVVALVPYVVSVFAAILEKLAKQVVL